MNHRILQIGRAIGNSRKLFLTLPLIVLCSPVLAIDIESESCNDETEQCEECVEATIGRSSREIREQPKSSVRLFPIDRSVRSVKSEQPAPAIGHKIKPDLLAPLTC